MLNTEYQSLEEILQDFSAEAVVQKINQFHLERNKRMDHNKEYHQRKREEFRIMKAELAKLKAGVHTVFVGQER